MTEVLNGPVYTDAPKPAFRPGPAGTHITIRGLTKFFAGWPLYENFDLDIPKNKIVSIFGPNGCGKSTLINMIAGLVPIDGGEQPARHPIDRAHADAANTVRPERPLEWTLNEMNELERP